MTTFDVDKILSEVVVPQNLVTLQGFDDVEKMFQASQYGDVFTIKPATLVEHIAKGIYLKTDNKNVFIDTREPKKKIYNFKPLA